MKRVELKTEIRKADYVYVYNNTLKTFVQVNKSKLLETLDKALSLDAEWLDHYFRKYTDPTTKKINLYIN